MFIAVKQLCHHGGSTSTRGCRLCKTVGRHRETTNTGMYFFDNDAEMRPLIDYVEGNEVSFFYFFLEIYTRKMRKR
jgi:hypothetical protein